MNHHKLIGRMRTKAFNMVKRKICNTYNTAQSKYYIKIINNIIFDEARSSVSVFKDYLLWDETSDFLKR